MATSRPKSRPSSKSKSKKPNKLLSSLKGRRLALVVVAALAIGGFAYVGTNRYQESHAASYLNIRHSCGSTVSKLGFERYAGDYNWYVSRCWERHFTYGQVMKRVYVPSSSDLKITHRDGRKVIFTIGSSWYYLPYWCNDLGESCTIEAGWNGRYN